MSSRAGVGARGGAVGGWVGDGWVAVGVAVGDGDGVVAGDGTDGCAGAGESGERGRTVVVSAGGLEPGAAFVGGALLDEASGPATLVAGQVGSRCRSMPPVER